MTSQLWHAAIAVVVVAGPDAGHRPGMILEKAVQLAPDDPAAHYQLGKLCKEMKALDRAKAEFDRTAELQSRAASSKPQ